MTELGFNYYNRRFIGTKLFSHYKQDFFAMTLSFVKVRDKLDSGIGNI